MWPDNLPLHPVPLIEIGMPIPLAWDVTALHDDLELWLVSNHRDIAIEADRDRPGFPVHVMDLPGADAAQILLLRQLPAQRVNELKVVGVQLSSSFNITADQRAEALALRRPEELRVPILAPQGAPSWSGWRLLELNGESA
jgi:hypothetical protein